MSSEDCAEKSARYDASRESSGSEGEQRGLAWNFAGLSAPTLRRSTLSSRRLN